MLYGFSGVILQGALVTLELAISSVVLAVLILLLAVLYFTRGSRRRRYGRSPRSYSSGYRGRRRH